MASPVFGAEDPGSTRKNQETGEFPDGGGMEKILEGVRLLDMTEGLAGPYAATLLGDMGASVLKVERPEGDWLRGNEEPLRPAFVALNRNKRNLCLNLQQEGAAQVVRRLVERSDIVLSNYRMGVMERLGVGYEDCLRIRPGILYCTVSGFGQKGRYSGLPTSDTGLQAVSGIMDSIGEPDGVQMRVSFPLVDFFAASLAVQGILLGLLSARRGQPVQRVDVSLLNAAMALQSVLFTKYLMTGELPRRSGNQNPALSPGGSFQAQDGKYLTMTVLSQAHWEKFCRALGLEELLAEERFRTMSLRVRNRPALNGILGPVFLARSREEWLRTLAAAGIVCGPVNTLEDVRNDPGLMESISLLSFRLMGKEVQTMGNPLQMDEEYPPVRILPCLKGEHTVEVLAELGYSREETDRLISGGVAISGQS